MKKQLLAIASLAFVLSGCSNATTTIQSGSDPLFSVGDIAYTKADEYNFQKKSNGATGVIQLALKTIYEKEVGLTDSIKKEAKKQVQESSKDVENFEKQIKNMGYTSIQDYTDKVIVPSVQSDRLIEKYMKVNKKEVQTKFKPSMAYVVECADEETAKQALADLKDGKEFKDVYDAYSKENSLIHSDLKFISTQSQDVPTRLVNTLSSTKKAGIIDEIFFNEGMEETTYYVAILDSNDYDKNLKQFAKNLKDTSHLSQDCLLYYLDLYQFEVHDQELFDTFKANNPEYLVTRPDLSKK